MNYVEQLEAFTNKLEEKTAEMVNLKGSQAGFKTEKVIDLNSHAFNANCGVVFRYVGVNKIFDVNGYEYNFNNLNADEFAELVDILTVI